MPDQRLSPWILKGKLGEDLERKDERWALNDSFSHQSTDIWYKQAKQGKVVTAKQLLLRVRRRV